MKKPIFFAAIIIAGLLQIALLNYFKVFTVKPDLFLVAVVAAGLFFELRWVVAFSLFAGIFKDAFCLSGGRNAVLFLLWGILVWRLNREFAIENNLLRSALTFIAVVMHNLVSAAVLISAGTPMPAGIALRIIALQPLITAVFTPLFFNSLKYVSASP